MLDSGEILIDNPGEEELEEGYDDLNKTLDTEFKDEASMGSLESSSSDEIQSTIDEGSVEVEASEFLNDDDDEQGAALSNDSAVGHEQHTTINVHHQTNTCGDVYTIDNGMHLLPLATIAVSEVKSCLEIRILTTL
jgi:hypothetical protein